MFSQHVSRELSAYCHGELQEEESRRVAEHLIGCQRCRREFEEIKLGVKLAAQLPRASAPVSLWNEVEAALVESSRSAELRPTPTPRRAFAFGWTRVAAACAVLLLALVIGILWYSTRQPATPSQVVVKDETQQTINPGKPEETHSATDQNAPATGNLSQPGQPGGGKASETVTASRENVPTWEVARVEGAPKVGTKQIEGSGRLAVGEWLETDATSRAKISVADIGQVDIGPNSRVRLVGTRSTEHRLALQRGRLHAVIDAPPRLFIVETPSATAIDLGCSYTLEVDDV